MTSRIGRSGWGMLVVVFCAAWMFVLAPEAMGEGAVVLSKASPWRCHMTWRTEQVRRASGELEYSHVKIRRGKQTWTKVEPSQSPPPAAGWAGAEFDDSLWIHAYELLAKGQKKAPVRPRTLSAICLRGKFEVKNPTAAGDMQLKMAFRGGAVVYMNGKEVGRAHLPKGQIDIATPAEHYPDDAYVNPDGLLLRSISGDSSKYKDRFAKRIRSLSVKIPAAMLRKGTNVLAVEIHRAPMSEVAYTAKCKSNKKYANWTMISMESLRLSAGNGGSVVPAGQRPPGVSIANASTLNKILPGDWNKSGQKLSPIRLIGARNGVFSGQVVLSSTNAITGVKATVTDLKSEAGVIPASAIMVRYATLAIRKFFDCLDDAAPSKAETTQPVWFTVRVPKDAKPGDYKGTVTVKAAGKTFSVPLEISVADWAIPDPKEFASFLGFAQSPPSVALQYKVPMWSKKHWELVEKVFEHTGKLGNKTIYLPLLRKDDYGNTHSMMRWVKQPGGGYKHDFSIIEKYVATAVKHLGKVPVVCLYMWHPDTGGSYFGGKHAYVEDIGMPITVVDPKTSKLEEGFGPKWSDPGIVEFWKPVVDGIRKILVKHGIEKSMMIGIATDNSPRKDAVDALKKAAPGTKWVVHRHPFGTHVLDVPIGYLAHVWGCSSTPHPSVERVYGWKNSIIHTAFPRYGCSILGHSFQTWAAISAYKNAMEAAVTSPGKRHIKSGKRHLGLGLRGIGQIGADFWPVDVDKRRSRKRGVFGRYPKANNHGANVRWSVQYILSPGENGPAISTRFEAMREGIQETEARIFLEKAISNPELKSKLGENLAKRCQDLLDERIIAFIWAKRGSTSGQDSDLGWAWFAGSGWQERSAKLYTAAAEVAGKLNAK